MKFLESCGLSKVYPACDIILFTYQITEIYSNERYILQFKKFFQTYWNFVANTL
jgi:hypothetical protein